MSNQDTQASRTPPSAERKSDHAKLISLLALAAGATAMPQTARADIIFSSQGATVSYDGLRSFNLNNLPGTAVLGFQAHKIGSSFVTSVRSVTGGQKGGYVRMKPALLYQSMKWNQVAGTPATGLLFGSAKYSAHTPDAINGAYVLIEFMDSTHGNAMRYGWVQISLVNGDTGGISDYPQLTVDDWAYDTTGAQLGAGVVPEPSSSALLILGALALGAKGVRSWRRDRPDNSRS
jgi:hypothetical protein